MDAVSSDPDSIPSRSETPKRKRAQHPSKDMRTSTMMKNAYEMLVNCKPDDEWDAFGNMIASNARTWSTENMAFARRYKAALSDVNAQFELEAANMTINPFVTIVTNKNTQYTLAIYKYTIYVDYCKHTMLNAE